ncbi:MAG: transcription elongation factor GreA [Proteobacteria bacterium]|jgi:transcription elongation factor GreA|nr:transcription elongation factor GreA [Pseudomonadota bacterium]HCK03149.1 transcription elongation factor GreA [Methylophilaceae bacterium]|tara:strand:+ start:25148 stop:25624 length:477 start_codon:yes stop_codon:yes gene_type:complete
MNQIPMTRVGQELLKKELQQLKSIDRPMVIQAISEARAQGDLSENAEYDAAKEKQAFIEGRLAEIEAKLSHATVIDPASLNAEGKCVFGSTVTIEDLDNEKKSTYQIVGDDESDIKGNKISINSPLAKSLIGKEEGDVVEFESPGGVKSFEILKVQYI